MIKYLKEKYNKSRRSHVELERQHNVQYSIGAQRTQRIEKGTNNKNEVTFSNLHFGYIESVAF